MNRHLTGQVQADESKKRGGTTQPGVARRSKARTAPQPACSVQLGLAAGERSILYPGPRRPCRPATTGRACMDAARGPAVQGQRRCRGLTTLRNPNAAPTSSASSPTTPRSPAWWAASCWSSRRNGSWSAAASSPRPPWPRSRAPRSRWNSPMAIWPEPWRQPSADHAQASC